MFKKIIAWIVSRFKYANKTELISELLNGIDDEDLKAMYRVISGRLNPILDSDNTCSFTTTSISDLINGVPIIIQDNKLIGYKSFSMIYNGKRWSLIVDINGEDKIIEEDDHTKIYFLI